MTDKNTQGQVKPVEIQAPALPYSFKANLSEYRKRISAVQIIAALAITGVFYVKFGPLVWILSVVGIAALIFVILYILSLRTVTLNPEGITYKNGLNHRRSFNFDQIEGVKVFLNYIEANFGTSPRVTIAIKGAEPLGLTALYWSSEDLDKLLAVLKSKNITIEYYDTPVSYTAIAAQFPRYVSYIERRPVLVATIITVAIIVVLAAIITIVLLVQ